MRLLIGLVTLLMAVPSFAARDISIAAIVNEEVISTYDLEERIKLVLATSGRGISPEMAERAKTEILQAMINETLRFDEAKRFSIMVSTDDLIQAITTIEQQQGKPQGSLKQFIESSGLSFDSFREQMKSQIVWRKLLSRQVRRDITITDEEIRRAQERIARGRSIPEVQIASVIIPRQDGLEQDELLSIARDIRGQLLSGEDASNLLLQYSNRLKLDFAPTNWVQREQLGPQVREGLAELTKGQITEPIITPVGIQIIRLLDTRILQTVPSQNAEVAIKQIIMKLNDASSDLEIDSKMDIAKMVSRYPGSCTESGVAGLTEFEGLEIDVNYYRTTLASMSPDVRRMVEPLPVTGITPPFASEDGIHLLMLCERISVPAPLPDTEKVRQLLFDEKLQLESEKYLRRLRREAFIDVRV